MEAMESGRLIYLVLLLAMLLGVYVVNRRMSLGRMVQYAASWALIFLGFIAIVGLWDDIRQSVRPQQAVFADQNRVEVPRSPDGHYYLTLGVNGVPVDFVIDTGASDIVLSRSDAERIGLPLGEIAYVGRAMTANGETRTAPVRLDEVALGPIVDRNMPAWVNEGEMPASLLGMAYLQRWERIEIEGGALTLSR